jgi:DNA-binding transcriptional LysR family regulator
VQAAAESLYMGSSGVSMALNRLRALTSDPLFIRGKAGLEPTAFARSLYESVTPALATIVAALRPTSFDPMQATGNARLALSEDLEIVLTSRLKQMLSSAAPGLQLTVRQADYRRAGDLLDDDAADIVVTARPTSIDARHRCEKLLDETFVALSDINRFPPDRPLTLESYLSAAHVLVSASGSRRGRIDDALAELGLQRNVSVVTESFAALPFLLRSSNLIANVPRAAGIALAQVHGLRMHELPFQSPSFAVAMTWRARDEHHPVLSWVRDVVREMFLAEQRSSGAHL